MPNINLSALSGSQWLLGMIALGLIVCLETLVCIGVGLVALQLKGAARFLFWPIAFVVVVGLLPGFLFGALLFGFMRPPFSGHIKPLEDQSTPQRGINGLIAALTPLSAPDRSIPQLPAEGA
jgi:hypothetical protein